jgi:hypothetical protein
MDGWVGGYLDYWIIGLLDYWIIGRKGRRLTGRSALPVQPMFGPIAGLITDDHG